MYTVTAAQATVAATLGARELDVIFAFDALEEMGILPTLTMVRVWLAGYDAGYDAAY